MSQPIDILNRQPFLENLIRIVRTLADNRRGCTFAIDGQWGCGKTFILDRFEEQISLFQDPRAAGNRYLLFRYNCWQYDYYDEPSMAIVAAIRDEVHKSERLLPEVPIQAKAAFEIAKDLGKELLGNVIETKIGVNPFEYADKLQDKSQQIEKDEKEAHLYDSYFAFKQALDDTKKQLSKMAEDKPIIILVDELDRCIPEYAIKVLERLHHLFDGVENVVVILAIDGTQLECAVKNIYGIDDSSVEKYLKKFVSFTLKLDVGTLDATFWDRHREYLAMFYAPSAEEATLLNNLMAKLFDGIDVRTQEKIMERIITLHKLTFEPFGDLSLLFFEILHQILPYQLKLRADIPAVLATIVLEIYQMRDQDNSQPLYKFLKQYLHLATNGANVHILGTQNDLLQLNHSSLGIACWYLAALQFPVNQKACGRYAFSATEEDQAMIPLIKTFDQLSRIIK